MKTEEGIVIESQGNTAKLKVGRHTDCKNCGACPSNNALILDAENPISAKPGERVVFEMRETNALKAAFIVFIMPIIVTALGVFLGAFIGKEIGKLLHSLELTCGILAFIISCVCVKLFDRSINNKNNKPIITHIL